MYVLTYWSTGGENCVNGFACSDGIQCIPSYYKCDEGEDCDDGSDELGCGMTSSFSYALILKRNFQECHVNILCSETSVAAFYLQASVQLTVTTTSAASTVCRARKPALCVSVSLATIPSTTAIHVRIY